MRAGARRFEGGKLPFDEWTGVFASERSGLGQIGPSGGPLCFDPRYGFGHEILTRHLEIVVRLEIQPEFRSVTETQA